MIIKPFGYRSFFQKSEIQFFFDKLINGVSKNLNSGSSKVGFSIMKNLENNTRLSLS
jgi:hypothetical protein